MKLKRKTKKPLRLAKPNPAFPIALAERLERLFLTSAESGRGRNVGVFDLDNTLLDGDIGDASIAHLLDNEISVGMTWSQYTAIIDEGRKEEAYIRASGAFAGMEDNCVRRFANVVLTMKDEYITLFEDDRIFKVLIPKPNPVMQQLVHRLIANQFKILIISASNQYLVEEVGAMFGISRKNCFGMCQQVKEIDNLKILQLETKTPIPYSEGKAEIYNSKSAGYAPLFTSGDSLTDLAYMRLTDEKGLILWRGSDEDFVVAREAIPGNIEMLNFNSLFE